MCIRTDIEGNMKAILSLFVKNMILYLIQIHLIQDTLMMKKGRVFFTNVIIWEAVIYHLPNLAAIVLIKQLRTIVIQNPKRLLFVIVF